ncbi:DUF1707 SHOCT-like domain-containing protein [Actinopolyspora saharensis]|uniref:DUF1707 domain-containing protein n=1 Tax=Actinopolyspora saharensis TaxID=995062 RepID=A0A1H1FWN5_9ACTN|nr:DUF1707 domain-containing protein [Actinopolyspora saharensis]SDR05351.1 protein of unknown function [Actinopolyspora saharensis]
MAEPDDSIMRASDADREAVVGRLRGALDEGRLDLAEFDERVRRAYAAATWGELRPLTEDLPAVPAAAEADSAPAPAGKNRKLGKEWRDWAGTSFVLVGIWGVTSLASGELQYFWPAIPVGIWALVLLAGMLFGFGGADAAEDVDPDDEGGASRR